MSLIASKGPADKKSKGKIIKNIHLKCPKALNNVFKTKI